MRKPSIILKEWYKSSLIGYSKKDEILNLLRKVNEIEKGIILFDFMYILANHIDSKIQSIVAEIEHPLDAIKVLMTNIGIDEAESDFGTNHLLKQLQDHVYYMSGESITMAAEKSYKYLASQNEMSLILLFLKDVERVELFRRLFLPNYLIGLSSVKIAAE